jgi:DNA-binding transcriptional regulator YiaG
MSLWRRILRYSLHGAASRRAWGPEHKNIPLDPIEGFLVLDVVNEEIVCIEVLYRDDLRARLLRLFPLNINKKCVNLKRGESIRADYAEKEKKATTDAVEILHRRYYQGKPERLAALERARADDHVARKIAALRTEAGLSQRQLAKLIGTTASVICRLEDADYEGHS